MFQVLNDGSRRSQCLREHIPPPTARTPPAMWAQVAPRSARNTTSRHPTSASTSNMCNNISNLPQQGPNTQPIPHSMTYVPNQGHNAPPACNNTSNTNHQPPAHDEESAPAFLNAKRERQQHNNPKISRNTKAQVTFAALNMNGRNGVNFGHENNQDVPVPDGVGGDLNVVNDPIDRLPHRSDDGGAPEALARFKRLLELKDGWRAMNPDLKAYTYTHPLRSHSRIDRILISPSLFKTYICAPEAPYIGKGRYAIPPFLLQDKAFMAYAVQEGALLLPETPIIGGVSLQQRFKQYKEGLQAFTQKRAKESLGALEQKKLKLQRER
ncbi:hypothetical protein FB451DRAFT_1419334 [Mycena latifolia]|nr:hypothetical protein FB451DRAFT_1419334 [Mycena latifolia]